MLQAHFQVPVMEEERGDYGQDWKAREELVAKIDLAHLRGRLYLSMGRWEMRQT